MKVSRRIHILTLMACTWVSRIGNNLGHLCSVETTTLIISTSENSISRVIVIFEQARLNQLILLHENCITAENVGQHDKDFHLE